MSKLAIVRFLSLLLLLAGCRSAAPLDPISQTNVLYARLMPKLFPIEVMGTGVAFRNWYAPLPTVEPLEVSFVIERSATFPPLSFGPITATYRTALDKPLYEQIKRLVSTVPADRIESRVKVATYAFNEQTCPGLGEILDKAEAGAYGLRWADAVWHPLRVDGIIKTMSSNYTFTCYGSPCLGLGEWSMRAQTLLRDCAGKSARNN